MRSDVLRSPAARTANLRLVLELIEGLRSPVARAGRLVSACHAYAHVDYLANQIVTRWGYDANEIAQALIGYSNEIMVHGEGRPRNGCRGCCECAWKARQ